MLFVALSLRGVSPKKDAASWGPRSGAFPSDPSLKAPAAAEEIRDSRRLSTGNITTGRGQIWFRLEWALDSKPMSKLDPARIASLGLP